ncbi:Uncharacterised protein [Mycobacteroides abscessus subsp. abscessus]|nr:Uncharacterised protein [Mycobacteroides abscessus subsp. abscessus]
MQPIAILGNHDRLRVMAVTTDKVVRRYPPLSRWQRRGKGDLERGGSGTGASGDDADPDHGDLAVAGSRRGADFLAVRLAMVGRPLDRDRVTGSRPGSLGWPDRQALGSYRIQVPDGPHLSKLGQHCRHPERPGQLDGHPLGKRQTHHRSGNQRDTAPSLRHHPGPLCHRLIGALARASGVHASERH